MHDHSDEDEDGEDDKLEERAEVSELQLICWEGEQHWGLRCTPVYADDEEGGTGTCAWDALGFDACTAIMGLVLVEDEDGEDEEGAAETAMNCEHVAEEVAAETFEALEERDRVGLRLLWHLPLPVEESTVLDGRGCCVCVFSWKGTVAFMGSRRPSKLTPAALIPGIRSGFPRSLRCS